MKREEIGMNQIYSIPVDPLNEDIRAQIQENWDRVAKPLDSLGVFEKITAQIGAITGTTNIDIQKRAILAMCADNGIVAEGVSQSGQEVSSIVTKFMGQNQSSVGKMAKVAAADVIVTDIGLAGTEEFEGVRNRKVMRGTRNFLQEPAMREEEALEAIAVGIETVREMKEQGYQLLGTGEMGIGNTTTSSAVAAALLGCPVEEITGRGAGLSEEGLAKKISVIRMALEKYAFGKEETFRILRTVGGLDIAGLVGVYIGGARYHLPVVMDGLISSVAALVAQRLVPGVRDYVIASHMSREPGAKWIMEELKVHPVIDAGLALGEGTGAVMMFSLLDMALALYESQTTFDEIQVEQYERFV